MSEEKMEQTKSTENIGEGNKPKSTPSIDAANSAAERLERANRKKEELLDREESLMVQARLSGVSEGGSEMPKESEDEKWAREAKIRYEGTGMSPVDD